MPGFRSNFFRQTVAGAIAGMVLLLAGEARAQYRMDRVEEAPQVAVPNPTITAKPGAKLPLDLEFTRTDGKTIKLDELFHHGRPVIMEMVYLRCPFMCGENQKTLAYKIRDGIRALELGKDFDVLIVSIDPEDKPEAAAKTRHTYLETMGKPDSQEGFTYLTGRQENIQALADAVGFGFRRNTQGGDPFLHSTGLFVLTPYGTESSAITNLAYTGDELHSALLAASDGKIGKSLLETVALPCGAMRLNPITGKYEANPWFWVGTAGGAATFAFMGIFLGMLWRGEVKRKRSHIDDAPPGGTGQAGPPPASPAAHS